MSSILLKTKGFDSHTIRDLSSRKKDKDIHQYSTRWDSTYDGQNAVLHIAQNQNGKEKDYIFESSPSSQFADGNDLYRDNIEEILSYPTENIPLHQRLLQDFPISAPAPIIVVNRQNRQNRQKRKTRRRCCRRHKRCNKRKTCCRRK